MNNSFLHPLVWLPADLTNIFSPEKESPRDDYVFKEVREI
jgi:hypothetical protein